MLYGFFNRVSSSARLRENLDAHAQRTRVLADRVATTGRGNRDGFALSAAQTAPGTRAEASFNLDADRIALADEQLRFEAIAMLLQKTYQTLRTSLRER